MIDENHDEELNPELLAKVLSYYPTLEKSVDVARRSVRAFMTNLLLLTLDL